MAASFTESASSSSRLRSLDALRGFDMLWIVGLTQVFQALAQIHDAPWLNALVLQLTHVNWIGFHLYDLIFPLFVFLSGISLAFQRESSPSRQIGRILRRTLLLVLLGAVYNGALDFNFAQQRWPSVLGLIGLSTGIAALIRLAVSSTRTRCLILFGWWIVIAVLQLLVPVPGVGAGVLTPEGILNGWIDRSLLPGRLHGGSFDPEGLLCCLSAVTLALSGELTGTFLRRQAPRWRQVGILSGAGILSLLLGIVCWKLGYPPIKAAWTASFDLMACGASLLFFALFYGLIDCLRAPNWSFPLQVVGMNPLLIYLLNAIIPFPVVSKFFFSGIAHSSGLGEPLVLAIGRVGIVWLLLYFLQKKKIFLRV